jgi:hypothetical protein
MNIHIAFYYEAFSHKGNILEFSHHLSYDSLSTKRVLEATEQLNNQLNVKALAYEQHIG